MKFLQEKISRYRAKIREEGKKDKYIEVFKAPMRKTRTKIPLLYQLQKKLSLNKENMENKFEKMEKEANIILGKKTKERTKDEKKK